MNLGEIKQAARDIIVDVTTAVENGLLTSIQRAQRELEFKTFCPTQEVNASFLYSQTVTNSGAYFVDFSNFDGVEYDFIRLINDPYLMDRPDLTTAPTAKVLTRLSASEAKEQRAIASVIGDVPNERGSPKYWELGTGALYFYPLPDLNGPYSSGRYQIAVNFYRHLTPLAVDSDTNWFTDFDECAEYMIFRAAEDGLRLIRDPLFQVYRQLAMERKTEAMRAARRRGWTPDDFIDVKPAARIGSYRP